MSVYADTGFICSLYCPDANSEAAIRCLKRHPLPLFLTWLNQVEFRNVLRLRVFRKEIKPVQRDSSLKHLGEDIAHGVFTYVDPDQNRVLLETERLSLQFSEKLGTRSLDVLHVAMALVLGCGEFLTFDTRQAKLAKSAGLRVPSL